MSDTHTWISNPATGGLWACPNAALDLYLSLGWELAAPPEPATGPNMLPQAPFGRLVAARTVLSSDQNPETGVTVANTTTATDLYRITIPGGTLKVGGTISARFAGRIYNNTGATVDFRFLFPWGAGAAITGGAVMSLTTTTSPRMWIADVDGQVIFDGEGHITTQDADTRFRSLVHVGSPASIGTEQRPLQESRVGRGLSVRNLTEDLDFGIQALMGTASASASVVLDFATVEVSSEVYT